MKDSKALIGEISREAERQGVPFRLHRNGSKHLIFHLGTSVVVVISHNKINPRSRIELLKHCEPELGYRWWMPGHRRPADRDDIPDTKPKGFRGPTRKRRTG